MKFLLLSIPLAAVLAGCSSQSQPKPGEPLPVPAGFTRISKIPEETPVGTQLYSYTGRLQSTVQAYDPKHEFPTHIGPGLLIQVPNTPNPMWTTDFHTKQRSFIKTK